MKSDCAWPSSTLKTFGLFALPNCFQSAYFKPNLFLFMAMPLITESYSEPVFNPIEYFELFQMEVKLTFLLMVNILQYTMHTVSFDWFMSSLEWILNLVLLPKTSDTLPEIIMEYQI